MPRPVCPKCGERQCSRKKREGLFQKFILPRLGWFPWQCSSCRRIFLVKERGKSKRKKFVAGQTYTQWQSSMARPNQPPGDVPQPDEDDDFLDEEHP